MKGIFKRMKGRDGKKGSSLIAVMTAMAVLSIVALCAAGIAITNYRTTQTYVSQDNYYYSAEAGQAQFISNINDVAYNFSSTVENWTEDKVEELYTVILGIEFDLSDTVYNGKYTVENEIKQDYVVDENGVAIFTIVTTVTNTEDNSTQEYTSTIKIENPIGESKTTGEDFIDVKMDASDPLMNSGYGLVTGGSYKNTTWYGLWGGFNTFYTNKGCNVKNIKTGYWGSSSVANPYYNPNSSSPLNSLTNASKVFSTEKKPAETSTGKKEIFTSGIWLKKVAGASNPKNAADNPNGEKHTNFFASSGSTVNGGSQTKLDNFFDNNIKIDVNGVVQAASKNSSLLEATTNNAIVLKYDEASTAQKYYAKYDGNDNFYLTFDKRPADTPRITLSQWKQSAGIDTYEPFYRVTCNENRNALYGYSTSHGMAYQYTEADGNFKTENTAYSWTYADHYYKNKWFFIDLQKKDGSLGTLKLDNSTSAEQFYDVELKKFIWGPWYYLKTNNYKVEDGWDITNYATLGNIVMEDCYFFVNGNVEIANGYNMSDCKILATGYIKLESVYYLEGLLSLETNAGSDTIKQSLYYTDSYFQSDLVSRYALGWVTDTESFGFHTYGLYRPGGSQPFTSSWAIPEQYRDCMIKNGYSYTNAFNCTGYLATYRYPTVLKATIIAEGKTNFTTKVRENNSGSTYNKTFSDVSVIFNPDGDVRGVVDCVLIEGQIFSRYHTFTANYNYDSTHGTNRYAAASQIQYHAYGDGKADNVFGELNEIVKNEVSYTEFKPIVIQNSGIAKK